MFILPDLVREMKMADSLGFVPSHKHLRIAATTTATIGSLNFCHHFVIIFFPNFEAPDNRLPSPVLSPATR